MTQNNYFSFSDDELPLVVPIGSRESGSDQYVVGDWTFDGSEDSDLGEARESALSYIAWLYHLEAQKAGGKNADAENQLDLPDEAPSS